jgi:acid phosphatase (class A)
MRLISKLFVFSLTLFFSVAGAEQTLKSELLSQTDLSPNQILPPPPAIGSELTRKEISEVKTWVAQSSAQERQLAAQDANNKTASFFSDSINGFNLDALPQTKALFEQVRRSEDQIAKVFKNHFQRPRPYITDPTISLCVQAEEGGDLASYPSGHATMAYSMGVTLAHLLPKQASKIMQRTQLYAENRMRCGAHHRSDIVAGQVLGTLIAVELLQNAKFQEMIVKAMQELNAAGLTQ